MQVGSPLRACVVKAPGYGSSLSGFYNVIMVRRGP